MNAVGVPAFFSCACPRFGGEPGLLAAVVYLRGLSGRGFQKSSRRPGRRPEFNTLLTSSRKSLICSAWICGLGVPRSSTDKHDRTTAYQSRPCAKEGTGGRDSAKR